MERKIDIPKWLVALMCSFIMFSGIASLTLPHPSAWIIPDECKWLEGKVVSKRIENKNCFLDACVGDSILVIDPSNNLSDNQSVHVSPVIYHSSPVGSPYAHYLCS
jgi:hypothetical protein